MGESLVNVNIVLDNKTISVPYNSATTAEDVCIFVCKQLNIGTVTRHLFALRLPNKQIFLMPAANFGPKITNVDFRIRFKVPNILKLKKIDEYAYNYYFHQARTDVLENKIPDIVFEKYKKELVGLGITDMYRVMLEKDISRESVENDYKKYIPKEVIKRHAFFIKKPIHDTLGKLQKSVHDHSYVKAEYIKQLEIIAPDYLSEVYKATKDDNGSRYNIYVKLTPYHPTEPGLKYSTDSKKDQWNMICTVDELGFVSIRNEDGTVEISRKNGIPFYLRFNSLSLMYSFISLLDGYYRLTCKWTFNICSEVPTPSLQKLYTMKCHGPVGGEFSYAKLEAKRNNKAGCFIIRESETSYNNYYIDVCMKEGLRPKTFKLDKINNEEFIFNDDLTKYSSIHQLMAAYKDQNGAVFLQECLPPSEYDDSPLLLCKNNSIVGDSLTDSSTITVPTTPMCIDCKNLQLYKGVITMTRYIAERKIFLKSSNVDKIMTTDSWTRYDISFNKSTFTIMKDNQTMFLYQTKKALIMYWFSVAAKSGWVTWSANCEPLDLDGPPKDGGWSGWSPWTCTVTCGGGEGYRTRTCSNPRPNIFGKLCQGSPTSNGKCNDFPCGDISPDTMEKIRESLQKESFSYVLKEGQRKEGLGGITVVYRGMWKFTKGKKIEVAMKMLKQDATERYMKDFLTLAGQWAFLQSSAIVKLYGIAFTSNFSLVMEYFKLGPLDQYLQQNKAILQEVDLIQASSHLASALWHLTENDIVHGNIRCRKVMVSSHEKNSFTVKLADPGIMRSTYASAEVHWIPIECYSNLNFAKRSFEADIWALGTTLWEIFMFGQEIECTDYVQAMRAYISGKRLPKPKNCSNEMYIFMKECWEIDPHKRKKPQALVRDINQILYQVYNSRQTHSYTPLSRGTNGMVNGSGTSTISLHSFQTESTGVPNSDDLVSTSEVSSEISANSSLSELNSQNWVNGREFEMYSDSIVDFSNIISSLNLSTVTTSAESLYSMQSVFELDGSYNVVLQGRIGQGFYGEVYKGTLECIDGEEEEPRVVAVKKLKTSALSSCLQDFEREINIMKTLIHPNIVAILGVLREPEVCLVMEFVPHGSLQSYLKIYRENLQEVQLLQYALDIAKGMVYLGSRNIVHRDLATRNILVVNENHVKISDFGLAQVTGTNDYYILKTPNRELPIKWYAPESLRDGKFSSRSDVWSYGVTLCEMFNYGEEPNLASTDEDIEGQQQQVLLNALEKGARFPCPPNCSKALYIRIIYPCWQANPHNRPLFETLVSEIEDILKQY